MRGSLYRGYFRLLQPTFWERAQHVFFSFDQSGRVVAGHLEAVSVSDRICRGGFTQYPQKMQRL